MNAMTETRRIERFPKYLFRRDGVILSMARGKMAALKGMPVGRYRAVELVLADGGRERIYIHRAICEAFHGPCPDDMQCRHLDGDPLNNAASNLAWGTPAENNADKLGHGTASIGERNPHAKLTREAVQKLRDMRSETGMSYAKLAALFGVSTMTAFRAATNQSWSQL